MTTRFRSQEKLNVAIIGAGIAGLTTSIALTTPPLINLIIYEKASSLSEIGASIALGPNGLRTLQRLGLHDVVSDEIAFRGPSNLPMIYRHWRTNEVIGCDKFEDVDVDEKREDMTARYWRGHLQEGLLRHVDRGAIRMGKSVVGVEMEDSGVKVRFEDGTEVVADLVIGADGLRSVCGPIPVTWRLFMLTVVKGREASACS